VARIEDRSHDGLSRRHDAQPAADLETADLAGSAAARARPVGRHEREGAEVSETPHKAGFPAFGPLSLEELAVMVQAAMVDGRWADTGLGTHAAAYLNTLEYRDSSLNTLAAYEYVLGLFCVESTPT
jgi:hypothetical protein